MFLIVLHSQQDKFISGNMKKFHVSINVAEFLKHLDRVILKLDLFFHEIWYAVHFKVSKSSQSTDKPIHIKIYIPNYLILRLNIFASSGQELQFQIYHYSDSYSLKGLIIIQVQLFYFFILIWFKICNKYTVSES